MVSSFNPKLERLHQGQGQANPCKFWGSDLSEKFQSNPHRRDLILFYKYCRGNSGNNGGGLDASHQTGWAGLVARIIMALNVLHADEF